jgi:putative ABC transport system permease protein
VSQPPRLAVWLTGLLAPAEERAGVLGDLHENYLLRLRTDGPVRAGLWYWGQALSLPIWFWGEGGKAMVSLSKNDIRYAVRGFLRTPVFTAIALLTLGLGIGANTAIFSVVDGVLLEPLPYPESDRLVDISFTAPGLDLEWLPSAIGAYIVHRQEAGTLEEVALYGTQSSNLTGGTEPRRIAIGRATPSLFTVLETDAALGRTFTEEEGLPDGPSLTVITDQLWREHFDAAPDVVGRTVQLDGNAVEVVGVLPAGFEFSNPEIRLWLPLRVDPNTTSFNGFNYPSIARLASGAESVDVGRELTALMPRLAERFDGLTLELLENSSLAPVTQPYLDTVVGDVKTALLILMGTVGFVLLIACANVANLLLVRAESRQKEVAIRTAMGADRAHLYGQFITESGLLALVGGGLGLLLAWLGLRLLTGFRPEGVPRLDAIGIDGSVLLFTAVLCGAAAVIFGVIPVLRHRSGSTSGVLRDGYRGSTTGGAGARVRSLLVVSQVAFALILLVGSGLMLRSFRHLLDVDPGFRSDSVLTFRLSLPGTSYADRDDMASFYHRFIDRLEAIPGVQVAGAGSALPLSGMTGMDPLVVEGQPLDPAVVPPVINTRVVTPGYFEALGIPLRQGRMFERRDAESAMPVALLSERTVETFFPDGQVLDRRVAQGLPADHDDIWSQVVGIVADVHYMSLTQPPMGTIYYPIRPADGIRWDGLSRSVDFVVRTAVAPTSIVPAVRQALAEMDPNLPIASVRTMDQIAQEARAGMGFTLILLGIAAAVGLLLGSVGLYGVISYVTAQRTREIGVRMALGAQVPAVRGMVMRQGLGVTLGGVVVGLAGAWGLTRFMESVLYEVSTTDPLTYAGVSGLLLLVAAAATWIPARRASRTDPVRALQGE